MTLRVVVGIMRAIRAFSPMIALQPLFGAASYMIGLPAEKTKTTFLTPH